MLVSEEMRMREGVRLREVTNEEGVASLPATG